MLGIMVKQGVVFFGNVWFYSIYFDSLMVNMLLIFIGWMLVVGSYWFIVMFDDGFSGIWQSGINMFGMVWVYGSVFGWQEVMSMFIGLVVVCIIVVVVVFEFVIYGLMLVGGLFVVVVVCCKFYIC